MPPAVHCTASFLAQNLVLQPPPLPPGHLEVTEKGPSSKILGALRSGSSRSILCWGAPGGGERGKSEKRSLSRFGAGVTCLLLCHHRLCSSERRHITNRATTWTHGNQRKKEMTPGPSKQAGGPTARPTSKVSQDKRPARRRDNAGKVLSGLSMRGRSRHSSYIVGNTQVRIGKAKNCGEKWMAGRYGFEAGHPDDFPPIQ